ncbi:MAG: PAS domain S-box protein [Chloroflexi bacterium]|nr:PAS domain S-box protein [Chloroflexota bacterium]
MTLRKKALLIIGLSLLALLALVYITSRFILLSNLEETEARYTGQNVERALASLSHILLELETTTADRASWDDTYAFIETRDDEYIQSNLLDETFITLGLNLMMFIDASGQIVFSKAFDLQNEAEVALPVRLQSYLSEEDLLSGVGTRSTTSGVVLYDEGPMLVVALPILTSDDGGPSRGTLIFGRYIDADVINRLSLHAMLPVNIYRLDEVRSEPGFQVVINALWQGEPVVVQPLSSQYVAGYTLIKDIRDNPVLILRVDGPRDLYQAGQRSVAYYILTILGAGLLLAGVVMLIIQKQVFSRFAALVKGVNRIAETGDTSSRISMSGGDELYVIAGTINGMLTALQSAEGELRQREEHYRLLADNASDIIFTLDMNLRFNYVSPSVTRLTGYGDEELIGREMASILTPASRDIVTRVFAEEMAVENSERRDVSRSWTVEFEVIRKDGSRLWMESILDFLRDATNQAIGILGAARDLTERKNAEETTAKLYQQEKDLRQKLEMEIEKRIEFTRALVHELKTPITPVLSSSELLLEELGDSPLGDLARNINRSANNLNERIDELLELAKSEIGIIRINPQPFDPAVLLQEIADTLMTTATRMGLTLHLELPDSLPTICADQARFRQIVVNLMNNAFKFTPEGGAITLKSREDGANLVVEVQDTGRGISAAEQELIFEPYHRTQRDKERLSGLGLGLSLSKTFVELHGGRIWVKSKPGKGSTFGFSLPIKYDGQPEVEEKGLKP